MAATRTAQVTQGTALLAVDLHEWWVVNVALAHCTARAALGGLLSTRSSLPWRSSTDTKHLTNGSRIAAWVSGLCRVQYTNTGVDQLIGYTSQMRSGFAMLYLFGCHSEQVYTGAQQCLLREFCVARAVRVDWCMQL
jgi:hypothetical protein